MSRVNDLILCECHCDEHQMTFKYDSEPEWENIYISYYLQSNTLWNRIETAIRHIFGHRSRYGDFGEIILEPDDVTIEKFENVVKHLKIVQDHQESEKEKKNFYNSKYIEIRLVEFEDHQQVRFVGEMPDEDNGILETGGVLFEVYHVDGHYILFKVANGVPFKLCNSIEELITYLRDKTGLILKQDIE